MEIAEFFIRFLTDEGDLVFDPFAGSNTTGATAELLNRRWISCEPEWHYAASSAVRFPYQAVDYLHPALKPKPQGAPKAKGEYAPIA